MKHASPPAQKQKQPRRLSGGATVASMPSLSSERTDTMSEDTSPGERKLDENTEVNVNKKVPPTTSEKTAVNALLMAAMAMTEMGGSDDVSTPPKKDEQDYSTPPTKGDSLSKNSRTPKRKQSPMDAMASAESSSPDSVEHQAQALTDKSVPDSPLRQDAGMTPSQAPQVKRTRIGSVRKTVDASNTNNKLPYTTPKQPKNGDGTTDLTPVSARCIDFRKMNVNGDA
jgi:hypothetical protein